MNPFSLFKPDVEYVELLDKIIEQDGEITPEQEKQLDTYTRKELMQVDRFAQMLSNFDYAIKQADEWIENINRKKQVLQNQKDFWKLKAVEAMGEMNINSLEGELSKLRVQESESVIITIPEKVPEEFIRTKIIKEPDKAAIKENLKDGKVIPGVELQRKKYLRVY